MPLPDDLHDEDANYMIRVCVLVSEAPILGFQTDSKVYACDRCGEAIWVKEDQVIPEIDEPIKGHVNLCFACVVIIMAEDGSDPIWLGPSPSDLT